jgi:hypothetical protein
MTTRTAGELLAIADRLEQIKNAIDDLAAEAGQLLAGLGTIRDRSKAWRSALDRATGSEPDTTLDDTIEEIRAEAGVVATRPAVS